MKLVSNINKEIFREYDVRGVYPTDINEDVAYTFGKAYGTYIKRFNQDTCVVGMDNRYSSVEIQVGLIMGIIDSGINVINIGLCTTPMFYYACILKNISAGVMVTASHNPKDDNGFKFSFDSRGNAKGKMISEFYDFLKQGNFDNGKGIVSKFDIEEEYFKLLLSSINYNKNKKLKVVIDCGNGTTSFFAPKVYSMLNIDLTVICGDSNPLFPYHHPDPCVEDNLLMLKTAVKNNNADIGIAFDGDGDRVGIIDEKGNYVACDKYMIAIIRDILPKSDNKKVLYDVKCSKALPEEIEKLGGEPIISRTGNSYTKAGTKENDCIFGGEFSGHVFFRDKFPGFDSGLYAGLRILEILSQTDKTMSKLLDGINNYYQTAEIKISSPDDIKKTVIEKIKNYCIEKGYNFIDIDGVRVEFADGWALVRCSNTGPNITARFEGKTEEYRDKLKEEFINLINEYNH